jgi:hypothetical protein
MNDLSNWAPSEKDSATLIHVMYVEVHEITRFLSLVHQETRIKRITTHRYVYDVFLFDT